MYGKIVGNAMNIICICSKTVLELMLRLPMYLAHVKLGCKHRDTGSVRMGGVSYANAHHYYS